MFPQISTLSLALRESPPETQRTLNQVLSQDKPQDARVLRSTAEPGGSGSARITLEVNGKTVQLITKQPLQSGNLLKISLTSDGKILLQQPPAASAPAPTPANALLHASSQQASILPQTQAQTQAQTAVPTQAKVVAQVISLKASSELIPINKGTTTEGTVIKSTPLAPTPTSSGSANPNATGGATYSRPIPVNVAQQANNPITSPPIPQPAAIRRTTESTNCTTDRYRHRQFHTSTPGHTGQSSVRNRYCSDHTAASTTCSLQYLQLPRQAQTS